MSGNLSWMCFCCTLISKINFALKLCLNRSPERFMFIDCSVAYSQNHCPITNDVFPPLRLLLITTQLFEGGGWHLIGSHDCFYFLFFYVRSKHGSQKKVTCRPTFTWCHESSAHNQLYVINTDLININELALYEMMHSSTLIFPICGLRAAGSL